MNDAVVQGAEGTPDIQADSLVKQYGARTVVNGVSLHASCGEIVGLLGPNGAGKTTTFYMVVGLVRPNDGTVTFRGQDITRMPVYRRARLGLGYLAQEPSTFRKLTVEENVLAILETMELTKVERHARVEELLASLNLTKVARQRAYTLSGGERRKLEIARALVRKPAILMLDEPFSGVDPLAVHDIQEIVKGLRDRGLGIIVTDHNVRDTLAITDRTYLIHQGQIVIEGSPDDVAQSEVARKFYLGDRFSW